MRKHAVNTVSVIKLISLLSFLLAACSTEPLRRPTSAPSFENSGLVKGVSVTYIHTPNKKLADWYERTLGLKKGYGDSTWQTFDMNDGSGFALDFISYPSSTVQKQSMVISFKVDDIHLAVEELAKKGVRFYPDNDKSKTIFDAGASLIATLEDPDGNFIQLSQPKK